MCERESMNRQKLAKILIYFSLIACLFFVVQALRLLNFNVNSLSQIDVIIRTIDWMKIGLWVFYLGIFLFVIAGLIHYSHGWLIGLFSYVGFLYLLRDIIQHIFNASRLFDCTFNYDRDCLIVVNQFERLDFGVINVNRWALIGFVLVLFFSHVFLLFKDKFAYNK